MEKAGTSLRILIHSNAPWAHTGYANQTAIWAPRFRDLGHTVTISAFYGLQGSPMMWDGIRVLPGGYDQYGSDIIRDHYIRSNSDVLITLCDIWVLAPDPLASIHATHWIPVDAKPLGTPDRQCLERSKARPIAMSRHGEEMLSNAGFSPFYVPHAINTDSFKPADNRQELRENLGVEDRFVIGINAANKDPFRKGMTEQLTAFAKLHEAHSDAYLMIHGLIKEPGSVDLGAFIRDLGVADSVRIVDQYLHLTGQVDERQVVNWYNALDLYSMCSYAEGFGLTAVEAQACGVPVVATNASSMPQVCQVGWIVNGEPFFNPTHQSWWVKPYISDIYEAYQEAYTKGTSHLAKAAREFALGYAIDVVEKEYWVPVLQKLEEEASA